MSSYAFCLLTSLGFSLFIRKGRLGQITPGWERVGLLQCGSFLCPRQGPRSCPLVLGSCPELINTPSSWAGQGSEYRVVHKPVFVRVLLTRPSLKLFTTNMGPNFGALTYSEWPYSLHLSLLENLLSSIGFSDLPSIGPSEIGKENQALQLQNQGFLNEKLFPAVCVY